MSVRPRGDHPAGRHAVSRTYAEIEDELVTWGWSQVLPRKMLSMLVGDPGLGKSLVTCDLAARFTRGCEMPCGGMNGFGEPVNVLLLAKEDPAASVIKSRLQKAGADLSRVHEFRLDLADGAYVRGKYTVISVCGTGKTPLTARLSQKLLQVRASLSRLWIRRVLVRAQGGAT